MKHALKEEEHYICMFKQNSLTSELSVQIAIQQTISNIYAENPME